MEWAILRSFDIAKFRPKLVIVEIQELQRRYLDNPRAQVRGAAVGRPADVRADAHA